MLRRTSSPVRVVRSGRTGPESTKGRLVVVGHQQPPVPRRRPSRLDVHPDQQREYGKRQEDLLIAMRQQRTRACEHLRRRCAPRVENTFFRYKSIIGDGLRARSPTGQGSEVVLGCEILNRMTELGRPVSYRIGR